MREQRLDRGRGGEQVGVEDLHQFVATRRDEIKAGLQGVNIHAPQGGKGSVSQQLEHASNTARRRKGDHELAVIGGGASKSPSAQSSEAAPLGHETPCLCRWRGVGVIRWVRAPRSRAASVTPRSLFLAQ